jgi:tryptophan synthase beta subunit
MHEPIDIPEELLLKPLQKLQDEVAALKANPKFMEKYKEKLKEFEGPFKGWG